MDQATYRANAATIVKIYLGKGLTMAQAIGVMTQFDAESSLSPKAIGDHGSAFGLAQMHPDRIAAIKKGCGIDLHALPPIADQCEAVWWELNASEHKALAALRAAKTAFDAGHDMCRFYERPASTAQYQIRGNKAEVWASYFAKHPV